MEVDFPCAASSTGTLETRLVAFDGLDEVSLRLPQKTWKSIDRQAAISGEDIGDIAWRYAVAVRGRMSRRRYSSSASYMESRRESTQRKAST